MKTISRKGFLTVIIAIASASAFGQAYLEDPKYGADVETRKECAEKTSMYQEYYRQNNFKDAYAPWQVVFNICPMQSLNIYIRGSKVLKYKIEETADPNRKKILIDSLMLMHDRRIEHFNKKGNVLGTKAQDLYTLAPERYEEAFKIAEEAVNITQNQTEISVLFTYMTLTRVMYENKKIEADKVIELYSTISDFADVQVAKKPEDNVKQAKDGIDAIFTQMGVAKCENIVAIFTPKFNANPNDVNLSKKIKALMGSSKECSKEPLFLKANLVVYKAEPSSDLAYDIAHLYIDAKQPKDAELYYNEAINSESDVNKRANYFYELASLTFTELKNPTQAKAMANKALEENPNLGRVYKLIGDMYASERNCGNDDFEKKAVFWAAVDKYAKAKQVEPELEESMNSLISTYSQYFPTKEDIFFHDLKVGDTFSIGCWINERTVVRERK
ncbi:MAG: hypothetical protein F9K37_06105 [Bacteroidales bacterium]|nr:MAG: hypothetical protein F9K37_06105 [Bacteroidales bacterium]